jgi:hypothetical protein
MLFRPEEKHGASGISDIFEPISKRDWSIGYQAFGIGLLNLTIFHLDSDRRPTIQTGRIDPHNFSREQPADRQRFESSLGEPFLVPFNSDLVLCWKVVKRGKGDNIVRIGV